MTVLSNSAPHRAAGAVHLILGTLLVVFYSGSALAMSDVGGCEKREYAEVNDISTQELLKEYCYNEEMVRILVEESHKMLGVQTVNDVKKVRAAMSECYDEQRKIQTVLTSRRAKAPSCSNGHLDRGQ